MPARGGAIRIAALTFTDVRGECRGDRACKKDTTTSSTAFGINKVPAECIPVSSTLQLDERMVRRACAAARHASHGCQASTSMFVALSRNIEVSGTSGIEGVTCGAILYQWRANQLDRGESENSICAGAHRRFIVWLSSSPRRRVARCRTPKRLSFPRCRRKCATLDDRSADSKNRFFGASYFVQSIALAQYRRRHACRNRDIVIPRPSHRDAS